MRARSITWVALGLCGCASTAPAWLTETPGEAGALCASASAAAVPADAQTDDALSREALTTILRTIRNSTTAFELPVERDDETHLRFWFPEKSKGDAGYLAEVKERHAVKADDASGVDLTYSLSDVHVLMCVSAETRQALTKPPTPTAAERTARAERSVGDGEVALSRADVLRAESSFSRAMVALSGLPSNANVDFIRSRVIAGRKRISSGLVISRASGPELQKPDTNLQRYILTVKFEKSPVAGLVINCELQGEGTCSAVAPSNAQGKFALEIEVSKVRSGSSLSTALSIVQTETWQLPFSVAMKLSTLVRGELVAICGGANARGGIDGIKVHLVEVDIRHTEISRCRDAARNNAKVVIEVAEEKAKCGKAGSGFKCSILLSATAKDVATGKRIRRVRGRKSAVDDTAEKATGAARGLLLAIIRERVITDVLEALAAPR